MNTLLEAEVGHDSDDAARVVRVAVQYADLRTEVHAIGKTAAVPVDAFEGLPDVERVIRVSEKFRTVACDRDQTASLGFSYNGIEFTDESFNLFPGMCAVDNPKNVKATFEALHESGITTTRADVYEPRTSPYGFQGHGKAGLPWVLELAGEYGIKVIAMEVTREQHIDEIGEALHKSGQPTGVMVQIAKRNAQNFDLLRSVGQQQEFPVLLERGLGITLEESLNAVDYIAQSDNHRIVFCLRGVETHLGEPHRNFVDHAHVPVVQRLTRLPVCIDLSHSVGLRASGPDGLLDIQHVTARGIVAGANMVLVDFHPFSEQALCNGPRVLTLAELPHFIEDCRLARKTYETRRALDERLPA